MNSSASKLDIFHSLPLFLLTLQGFNFPQLGFAPLPTIGGLIICFYSFTKSQKESSIGFEKNLIFALYALIFGSSIISFLYYQDAPDTKRIFGFIFMILIAFSSYNYLKLTNIKTALTLILIIHSLAFYIQFFGYYFWKLDIDFIKAVTGVSQSGWGGSYELETLGKLRRFGGLFNEPGTYATFIAPLLAIYLKFFMHSKLVQCVTLLTVLSLILTFSTFALVFVSLISLYIIIFFKGRAQIALTVIYSAGAIIIAPYFLYRFFERADDGIQTGLEFRDEFITRTIDFLTSGVYEFLFGTGNFDINLHEKINFVVAINDSSLFFASLLTTGFILTTTFFISILFFLVKTKNKTSVLSFMIISLSKISLFWPFSPLLLALLFINKTTR